MYRDDDILMFYCVGYPAATFSTSVLKCLLDGLRPHGC